MILVLFTLLSQACCRGFFDVRPFVVEYPILCNGGRCGTERGYCQEMPPRLGRNGHHQTVRTEICNHDHNYHVSNTSYNFAVQRNRWSTRRLESTRAAMCLQILAWNSDLKFLATNSTSRVTLTLRWKTYKKASPNSLAGIAFQEAPWRRSLGWRRQFQKTTLQELVRYVWCTYCFQYISAAWEQNYKETGSDLWFGSKLFMISSDFDWNTLI